MYFGFFLSNNRMFLPNPKAQLRIKLHFRLLLMEFLFNLRILEDYILTLSVDPL